MKRLSSLLKILSDYRTRTKVRNALGYIQRKKQKTIQSNQVTDWDFFLRKKYILFIFFTNNLNIKKFKKII